MKWKVFPQELGQDIAGFQLFCFILFWGHDELASALRQSKIVNIAYE